MEIARFIECLNKKALYRVCKADRRIKLFEIYIYKDFYNYIYGRRIYISPNLIKQIGRHEWYSLLHEFVGALVIGKRNGIAVDILYMKLIEMFPWIFSEETVAEADQLEKILEIYREARKEKKNKNRR